MFNRPRSPDETQEVNTLEVLRALQAHEEELFRIRKEVLADMYDDLGDTVLYLEEKYFFLPSYARLSRKLVRRQGAI